MPNTENIESIIGNPRKAINKLAFPTIFSMLLMFLNNLIDSFWVAGINSDALAALGFISPLYLVIIGLGSGVGAGANSLISRYVGARRIEDANNAIIKIREKICQIYGQNVAERVIIQYGGSMKPNNAKELLEMSDIDGGLIGGASLKAEDFASIVNYEK